MLYRPPLHLRNRTTRKGTQMTNGNHIQRLKYFGTIAICLTVVSVLLAQTRTNPTVPRNNPPLGNANNPSVPGNTNPSNPNASGNNAGLANGNNPSVPGNTNPNNASGSGNNAALSNGNNPSVPGNTNPS